MRISEIQYDTLPPIDSYGGDGFRIAGQFYKGSQIINHNGVSHLQAKAASEITTDNIALLINQSDELDVVLIGTGTDIAPLPAKVRSMIEASDIGIELMKTSSACRTYNVLLAEGRRIAAILIAVD